ncbi:HAD family hydrolase [Odoribacter sp. OttesenSCG-928-G04]|nr:HAD family hydrolase [Odoribacter sp. OttesenSCG-928-G04]MDL2331178.1 HAD family hydrolase [Odoribacter sp. OttesenSCG-928-A06]
MKKYKNIVWDWNGTLLDDLESGVLTLNHMLGRRGLAPISVDQYKEVFGFPVEHFYEKVGFDFTKESFHDLSVDFVETYALYEERVALTGDVPEVLAKINEAGGTQYVLSALRENRLKEMLTDFDIIRHFTQVCGSDNIYAAGKIDRGRQMVEAYGIRPEETLMVGDTIHDAEVAEAIGFDCILYAGGHNSYERLKSKTKVIHRMGELLGWVTG